MTIRTGITYKMLNQMAEQAEVSRWLNGAQTYTVWDSLTVADYTFVVSVTVFKGLERLVYLFEDAHARQATDSAAHASDIYAHAVEWAFS